MSYTVSPVLCDNKRPQPGKCVYTKIRTFLPLFPSTSSAVNRTLSNHNPPHPRHHFLQLFSIHQFQQHFNNTIFVNILTVFKLLSTTAYHYEVITRGYRCCSASAETRNWMHKNHSWAQTRNLRSPNESFWINSKR